MGTIKDGMKRLAQRHVVRVCSCVDCFDRFAVGPGDRAQSMNSVFGVLFSIENIKLPARLGGRASFTPNDSSMNLWADQQR